MSPVATSMTNVPEITGRRARVTARMSGARTDRSTSTNST